MASHTARSKLNDKRDDHESAYSALKQAIDHMAASVQQGMDIETVTQTAKQSLIAVGFTPDYLELRNAHNLKPACDYDKELVIVAAAYLGKARLIDNLTFTR